MIKQIIICLAAIFAIISVPTAYASEQSAYQSGYGHGRDDCSESPDDRYINEPGKGPSQHTSEFMNGYHDGFNSCGGSSGGGGSGSNRERVDPDTDPVCNLHPGLLAGCKIMDELTKER